jgi:hypothetical protein
MRDQSADMNYFASPEKAVPLITTLLRQEDFRALATYYDLSNSNIPRTHLESGAFFIRAQRPEVAHPAELWRYDHPFPPGSEYSGMRPSGKPSVYIISVEISIDQGAESPRQVGRSFFYMIQSVRGWQICPEPVTEGEESDLPRPEVAE